MIYSDLVKSPRTFEIRLPIRLPLSKKKMGGLNLNIYRNLHHYQAASQKIAFATCVKPYLKGIPRLDQISLEYRLFYDSKRRIDVMNFGSIVDKYFSDTLVEYGIIGDDDSHTISSVSFEFGGYAKDAHFLVRIQEERKNMHITFDTLDIQNAIRFKMASMGLEINDDIELSFEDGQITAEVTTGSSTYVKVLDQDTPSTKSDSDDPFVTSRLSKEETDEPAPRKRRGRRKGSKNKPKEEDQQVEADVAEHSADSGSDANPGASEDGKQEATPSKTKKANSLFGDDEEVQETSATAEASGGRKTTNPFGESREASSKIDSSQTEETGTIPTKVKPVTASGLFGD